MGEVLSAFLRLGLTSFGGPIAHLGYFRRELVERRQWVSESDYAQLLALSQFLPGPASSQLGFALGLIRAGWLGALAAFTAFTLPSALLLVAFALWLPKIEGSLAAAALHGLKLVALAVVAVGVLQMWRRLCHDVPRRVFAVVAAVVMILVGGAWTQIALVAAAAIVGGALLRRIEQAPGDTPAAAHGVRVGGLLLVVFFALLVGLPFVPEGGWAAVAAAFYRAGALVFGGGHVVLPLLEQTVVAPGWVSGGDFLAGYGAAQAIPGPMFSFAAFLGARLPAGLGGPGGAAVATLAIFLPGFLLMAGVLPLWHSVAARPRAARAVAGVNAAVVGLLGAALYDPIWTGAVRHPSDLAIAAVGFVALLSGRVPPLVVVGWCVAGCVLVTWWVA